MPYFEPLDSRDDLLPDAQLKEEIARVRRLSEIQAALFDQEMVRHRFLDETGRRQETVYADGTVIRVDFNRGTYRVIPSQCHQTVKK